MAGVVWGGKAGLNTHSHLEEGLQRDIETLRQRVIEMARLVERALQASVRALTQADRPLAYSVILRDQYIDERETQLDRLCLEFLVRHQPAGAHLRLVFATIHINRELERIGDYAESIARQVLVVSSLAPQPSYERFVELGTLATAMLNDAIQAFARQDTELAWRTMAAEEQGNTLRHTINQDLAELQRRQELAPAALGPLTTVARRLERAADQVKNICEDVLYWCTGEFVKHKSADTFRVLFFDRHNACLSQLAEAIGNSLRAPRISFSSAGGSPQPIDPSVIEFLTARGIDASRPVAKTLAQVPGWEQYQVIVLLEAAARELLPPHLGKTIILTWLIPDPALPTGPPERRQAALDSAARALESNIRELIEAISEEPKPEHKL